jgi:hypothetical protein
VSEGVADESVDAENKDFHYFSFLLRAVSWDVCNFTLQTDVTPKARQKSFKITDIR